MSEQRFELRLLGPFEACSPAGCSPVRGWQSRRAGRRGVYLLLAVLASEHGSTFRRDELIAAVWPESDYVAGESSFYAALRAVRRRLAATWDAGREWIESEGHLYRLRTDNELVVDLDAFRDLSIRARRRRERDDRIETWSRIHSLYRGEFLADAPTTEPWIEVSRHRYQEIAITAALRLSRTRIRERLFTEAEDLISVMLTRHPEDERIRALLLECYRASGRLGAERRATKRMEIIDAALPDSHIR